MMFDCAAQMAVRRCSCYDFALIFIDLLAEFEIDLHRFLIVYFAWLFVVSGSLNELLPNIKGLSDLRAAKMTTAFDEALIRATEEELDGWMDGWMDGWSRTSQMYSSIDCPF